MCAKKILLIENDPDDQELMMSVIDEVAPSSGCYAVSSVAAGVELLDENHFVPDCIIFSNVLPDMTPSEIVAAVKKNPMLKQAVVMLVAVAISEEDVAKLKKNGVDVVLNKSTRLRLTKAFKKFFAIDAVPRHTILCL